MKSLVAEASPQFAEEYATRRVFKNEANGAEVFGNVKLEKKRLNWRGQTLRFQAHLLMSVPIFAWRKRGFRLM